MVAEIKPDIVNNTSPDAEWLGVCDSLQGHVSQSIKQVFTCERKRTRVQKKLKLEMREYLIKDQFTNLYCVFVADLIDAERHCVPCFIGSETRGLNKKYKAFQSFSDDMLHHMQDEAWVIFGRATAAIMKARNAANVVTLTPSLTT